MRHLLLLGGCVQINSDESAVKVYAALAVSALLIIRRALFDRAHKPGSGPRSRIAAVDFIVEFDSYGIALAARTVAFSRAKKQKPRSSVRAANIGMDTAYQFL